jgi:hypothetical protein
VKNITVTVPEEVHRRARVAAAERNTSVSALVREFLEQLASGQPTVEDRKRLQADVLAAIRRFRAGSRLTRERAHDRRALR